MVPFFLQEPYGSNTDSAFKNIIGVCTHVPLTSNTDQNIIIMCNIVQKYNRLMSSVFHAINLLLWNPKLLFRLVKIWLNS